MAAYPELIELFKNRDLEGELLKHIQTLEPLEEYCKKLEKLENIYYEPFQYTFINEEDDEAAEDQDEAEPATAGA